MTVKRTAPSARDFSGPEPRSRAADARYARIFRDAHSACGAGPREIEAIMATREDNDVAMMDLMTDWLLTNPPPDERRRIHGFWLERRQAAVDRVAEARAADAADRKRKSRR